MLKITMTSGKVVYRDEKWQAFRSYVNAANSKGAACLIAYETVDKKNPIQIQLQNVEFFSPVNPDENPMVEN